MSIARSTAIENFRLQTAVRHERGALMGVDGGAMRKGAGDCLIEPASPLEDSKHATRNSKASGR